MPSTSGWLYWARSWWWKWMPHSCPGLLTTWQVGLQYMRLQDCMSWKVVSNTRGLSEDQTSTLSHYRLHFSDCTYWSLLQTFCDGSTVVGCLSRSDEWLWTTLSLDKGRWSWLQGLSKPSLFSEAAEVLHHLAHSTEVVLRVCGCECCPLCYLGQQAEDDRHQQVQATHQKGQWHRVGGGGPSIGGLRGEDPVQTKVLPQQWLSLLCDVLVYCRSSFNNRLKPAKCSTKHHRSSFIPVAIRFYNSSM